jgi:hypothetical protein
MEDAMTRKAAEPVGKETTLFVDDIEDDSASPLRGDHSLTAPRALLPDDAHEGGAAYFATFMIVPVVALLQ